MMSAENPMGLFARFGHPPIRPMPANRKPAKPLVGTALVKETCRRIRLARSYFRTKPRDTRSVFRLQASAGARLRQDAMLPQQRTHSHCNMTLFVDVMLCGDPNITMPKKPRCCIQSKGSTD